MGYERTVEPQIVNALLSRHDFILLGLRGQAKTRLLRSLSRFLDEWIPAVEGCPLNSDPCDPVTRHARQQLETLGDETPLVWLHREQRYQEKLATPDVTIADLIGDIDPIKAATLKLDYSDERVIHYGIIPRTNRGIFAINELPDLQPRIQVGLLNILEEKDFQIRGFPVRMPLDLLMVFSANPEDYTNRGNIITPLRDRISSQIITHYPLAREDGHGHHRAGVLDRARRRGRGRRARLPARAGGGGGHPGAPQRVRGPELGRVGAAADRAHGEPDLERRAPRPRHRRAARGRARLRPAAGGLRGERQGGAGARGRAGGRR